MRYVSGPEGSNRLFFLYKGTVFGQMTNEYMDFRGDGNLKKKIGFLKFVDEGLVNRV